jgi:hypothetical protein
MSPPSVEVQPHVAGPTYRHLTLKPGDVKLQVLPLHAACIEAK